MFDVDKCIPNRTINDSGVETESSASTQYAYEDFIQINDKFVMSITSDNGTAPNNANGTRLRFYDENKNLVRSEWFATHAHRESDGRKYAILSMDGAKYLKINFSASGGGADTSYEAMTTIQIEEGSAATPYEPYKTNILTTSEDVELRGIGEVKDTLDISTGEKVDKIAEIVLDGSDDEVYSKETLSSGIVRFNFSGNSNNITQKSKPFGQTLCDRLMTRSDDRDNLDYPP